MSALPMSPFLADVRGRLAKVLGAGPAETFVTDTLRELGLPDVRTPDELMRFASHLVRSGGFVGIVGRSLRVQALLRGASEPAIAKESA